MRGRSKSDKLEIDDGQGVGDLASPCPRDLIVGLLQLFLHCCC